MPCGARRWHISISNANEVSIYRISSVARNISSSPTANISTKRKDFDPKMSIFQPFERVFSSKGCSFLRFAWFLSWDKCDFRPKVKNPKYISLRKHIGENGCFCPKVAYFSLKTATSQQKRPLICFHEQIEYQNMCIKYLFLWIFCWILRMAVL